MTKFENKVTKIGNPEITYFKLLEDSTNFVDPNKGIKVDEMRLRLSISGKISDKSAKSTKFTDDELKMVKDLVANTTWGMFHEDLIQFIDYVDKL